MKKRTLTVFILLLWLVSIGYAVNYAVELYTGIGSGYVSIGLNKLNPLFGGASGLSFEGWIKPSSFSASDNVIFSAAITSTSPALYVGLTDNGKLEVGGCSGLADTYQSIVSPSAVGPLDEWVHVAGVLSFESGNKYIRAYVNGVEVVSSLIPAFANNTYVQNTTLAYGTDIIGSNPAPPYEERFLGTIEEFRVWKYARTQAQIAADMGKELLVPQTGLVAYWKFNAGSGTTAMDNSLNNNNGTLTASASWTDICAISIMSCNNPAIPAGYALCGTPNLPIYRFALISALDSSTLIQVNFVTGGTYVASDISNFKIWYNNVDDCGSAVQFGAYITTDLGVGSHSFTGLNLNFSADDQLYFWITADLSYSAVQGHTIFVDAMTNEDFFFNTGSKIGSASVGGVIIFDGVLPIELSSFTATVNIQNYVNLRWVTQSETNVMGYYIYRNSLNYFNTADKISPLINATNSTSQSVYLFEDADATVGQWYYWLQNVDFGGSDTVYGPSICVLEETDVGSVPDPPIFTGIEKQYIPIPLIQPPV